MSDRRRDQTYELPRSSRDELLASQRKLASKQHMTLPLGATPEPDAPTSTPGTELSAGVHVPDRANIPAADIHQAIGPHIDLLSEDERDKLLLALGAHKYALAASIVDSEVKRYPKNLSLSRAASAVRHYAIGRAEADLGALFVAPRLKRPPPPGLSPEVTQAVRMIDGKTPIESIIRQTKLDRLKALDALATLARMGVVELPRVATPAPAGLILAPVSAGPVERPRAASSDSVVRADASPPRAESGVHRSDRPAATLSEPGLPAVLGAAPAVASRRPTLSEPPRSEPPRSEAPTSEAPTSEPPTSEPPTAEPATTSAAMLADLVPDLDIAPPKRAVSAVDLPQLPSDAPTSAPPSSDRAQSFVPEPPASSRRLTEAEVAAKVRELVPAPLEVDGRPLSSRRPEISPASPVSSSPAAPPSSRRGDSTSPRTPASGVALGLRPSSAPTAPPSRTPWLVGLAAVGVAAAGFFAYQYLTKPTTPAAAVNAAMPVTPTAPAPTSAPAPPQTSVIPEPAMETITVDIWAEPKYARVYLDGVLFTETPIHVSIPRSDKAHEVKVEAPGHKPRVTTFGGKDNASLVITLERVPRRVE